MIGIYYLIISIITFITYGADKQLAKAGGQRVPEKILFLLGLLGGCFGAIPGMLVFRHKTRKQMFWIANISFCLLHLVIFFAIIR